MHANRIQLENEVTRLNAEVERLRKELQELSQYAAGHHAQQESCEWLHALTVDIPHHIEIALGEQGKVMNSREMSEWLRNLNFFACPVAANKIDELAAEVERLRAIADFFVDWHGEEEYDALVSEAKACRDRTESLSKLVCQQAEEMKRFQAKIDHKCELLGE